MTIEDIRGAVILALERYRAERGITASAPVTLSPLGQFGDLSIPIGFIGAKELKQPPLAVAEDAAAYLRGCDLSGVAEIAAAAPGYVNIVLAPDVYAKLLQTIATEGPAFGSGTRHEGELWAIEHTSPNPNKAMHLGHLRNNLVGMAAGRILEANGARVVYDCIDNNRGIAIAKLMWGFLAHMRKSEETPLELGYWQEHKDAWYTPDEKGMLPDVFVTECYVKGSNDCKDPVLEERVRAMVVAWEANDHPTWELWAHVLSYSYAGMDRTLRRLGNRWDVVWHEHEHYLRGKQYVEEGLEKGVFKRVEDGAIVTDLASFDLPDTIVQKRDGTSLYITQDLALTALKKEKYHADHLVWVIGPEQSLALRQLFAVCEQLGIGKASEFTHVPYGYVGLRDDDGGFKKMSSRDGNVVLIDDVIDAVRDALMEGALKDRAGDDTQAHAEKLAIAAVKFGILKTERTQDIAFDIERSLETKGDSGIYVLYTYVRTAAVLRKARALGKKPEAGTYPNGREVARLLSQYPFAVARADEDLSAHHIAQYLLELCGAFNRWYNEEHILDEAPSVPHKLAVAQAVGMVIKNGLALLGVETVEEM